MSELTDAKARAWDVQVKLRRLMEEHDKEAKEWQEKLNAKRRELDEMSRQAQAALDGKKKDIDDALVEQHKADGIVEYLERVDNT